MVCLITLFTAWILSDNNPTTRRVILRQLYTYNCARVKVFLITYFLCVFAKQHNCVLYWVFQLEDCMISVFSWFGTFVSILGSFAVASAYFKIGYVLFTLGSFSWLYVAFCKRDKALAVLNGTFFLANLLGIYNNFF